MSERMIDVGGVQLCSESFGDPADPPVLLIMGIGASMLWWEEEFCRRLADGGRHVIRYDHRDTGRSAGCPPGRPDYSGAELTTDAIGVLDAHGIAAAQLVGLSAGAGIAQEIALEQPERVRSLVLISSSPAVAVDGPPLPPPTDAFGRGVAALRVDWSRQESMVAYMVDYMRVLAGEERPFDAEAARDLVRRDVARARDYPAVQNHDLLHESGAPTPQWSLSTITASTVVIHGTADPMFPLEHGEALAAAIPGARLLRLDGAGHGIERADWDVVLPAVLGLDG